MQIGLRNLLHEVLQKLCKLEFLEKYSEYLVSEWYSTIDDLKVCLTDSFAWSSLVLPSRMKIELKNLLENLPSNIVSNVTSLSIHCNQYTADHIPKSRLGAEISKPVSQQQDQPTILPAPATSTEDDIAKFTWPSSISSLRFSDIIGCQQAKSSLRENVILPLTLDKKIRRTIFRGIRSGARSVNRSQLDLLNISYQRPHLHSASHLCNTLPNSLTQKQCNTSRTTGHWKDPACSGSSKRSRSSFTFNQAQRYSQ